MQCGMPVDRNHRISLVVEHTTLVRGHTVIRCLIGEGGGTVRCLMGHSVDGGHVGGGGYKSLLLSSGYGLESSSWGRQLEPITFTYKYM
jgi:hypothetical protein